MSTLIWQNDITHNCIHTSGDDTVAILLNSENGYESLT